MKARLFTGYSVFAGICMLFSCNPSGKISVSNVHDTRIVPQGSVIYGLPQTVIDITAVAEELTIIPGPYHQFASKYLGIENAPATEQKEWNISEVSLNLHTEVDPVLVYSIEKLESMGQYSELEKLIQDSLILFPVDFTSKILFYNTLPYGVDDIHYFDLSIKENFDVQDSEVLVSLALPGPDQEGQQRNAQVTEKMLEQKAEEAAQFILRLRRRRFKLVAGQSDNIPEGQAMIEALKQLDKTEEEYLSLFVGKRIARQHVQTFHFVPGSDVEEDRNVLFRFSENEGFVDARESNGIPVLLELKSGNKTGGLSQAGPSIRQKNNFMVYRIPDLANAQILFGEELIVDGCLPVYQYGKIVTIHP